MIKVGLYKLNGVKSKLYNLKELKVTCYKVGSELDIKWKFSFGGRGGIDWCDQTK